MTVNSGTERPKVINSQSSFPFIKLYPLVLSLGRSSRRFGQAVASMHVCVLSLVCCRLKEQSWNPDSLHAQVCSGQEGQTGGKIEGNKQGQGSLKTQER